jgi:hypothetical protein
MLSPPGFSSVSQGLGVPGTPYDSVLSPLLGGSDVSLSRRVGPARAHEQAGVSPNLWTDARLKSQSGWLLIAVFRLPARALVVL